MSFLSRLLGHDRPVAEPRTASDLALYHFSTCPFCVRVRMALTRFGLDIELRDIHKSREHLGELLEGGGKTQVPCLRIEREDGSVEWLYESSDIIRYLQGRVAEV